MEPQRCNKTSVEPLESSGGWELMMFVVFLIAGLFVLSLGFFGGMCFVYLLKRTPTGEPGVLEFIGGFIGLVVWAIYLWCWWHDDY